MPVRPGEVYSKFVTKDGREVVLRTLGSGDLSSLLKFANELATEKLSNHDLGIVSFDRRMTRKGEKEFLDQTIGGLLRGERVSVAAFFGKNMVGNCDIRRRPLKEVWHAGTLGIVILREFRRVGLGEELMTTALAEAKKMGVRVVELEVFSTNRGAKRLYRKMGFKAFGTTPKKYLREGRFIDAVHMYAHLAGQTI